MAALAPVVYGVQSRSVAVRADISFGYCVAPPRPAPAAPEPDCARSSASREITLMPLRSHRFRLLPVVASSHLFGGAADSATALPGSGVAQPANPKASTHAADRVFVADAP